MIRENGENLYEQARNTEDPFSGADEAVVVTTVPETGQERRASQERFLFV
jgi:hypothetical protein